MEQRVIELGERVARLETQLAFLVGQVNHIDICVDGLKRTVWQASGAVAIIVLGVELLLKSLH